MSEEDCKRVDTTIVKMEKFCDIKLQLLDHHKTGLESSKLYDWYYLDDTMCATRIVFKYFEHMLKDLGCLDDFSKLVNTYDMWYNTDDRFNVATLLS
jgi:oligoribonuclease NrnB/cAMP/cGMP phosphodiesterase (DHH superfamily)